MKPKGFIRTKLEQPNNKFCCFTCQWTYVYTTYVLLWFISIHYINSNVMFIKVKKNYWTNVSTSVSLILKVESKKKKETKFVNSRLSRKLRLTLLNVSGLLFPLFFLFFSFIIKLQWSNKNLSFSKNPPPELTFLIKYYVVKTSTSSLLI